MASVSSSTGDYRGILGLGAIDRLKRKVEKLGQVDYTPLMREWQVILVEDNERGLMAGLDANDRPMPPTQRERDARLSRRKGGGPPLVPKGRMSRAIRDFRAIFGRDERGNWTVTGLWQGFTDRRKGRFILGYHADARGARYPRRDVIKGIRPTGRKRMKEAYQRFLEGVLRAFRGQ